MFLRPYSGAKRPKKIEKNQFRLGYQGQEYESAVKMYGFSLRMYDQRLGRWHATDPYEQHWSPYLAMSNNPVSFVDPDGGWDHTYQNFWSSYTDPECEDCAWGTGKNPKALPRTTIMPKEEPTYFTFAFDRPASSYMFSRIANSGYVGMASTALIMQSAGMLRSQINMVHAGDAPEITNRMEEPARDKSGSIESAIEAWSNLDIKDQTIDGFAAYVRKENTVRYIYTTQRGWIDLSHYFLVQQKGLFLTNLLEPVGGTATGQIFLSEDADRSTYSYEDLPTNKFSSEIDLSGLQGSFLISKISEHFMLAGLLNQKMLLTGGKYLKMITIGTGCQKKQYFIMVQLMVQPGLKLFLIWML